MNFLDFALELYPYWLMGLFVIWATIKSGNKDAIRVEPKAVFKWIGILCCLTIYRIFVFKCFPNLKILKDAAHMVTIIPWAATLTVGWEDLLHSLPLLLLQRLIGTKRWTWPIHGLATFIVMVSFASGHLYQGIFSALFLSLYIPYSIRLGKRFGFGTVMVCHTLYDLSTILGLKFILGL